jgi:phosphatidylinositol glycan class Z
LIAILTDTAFYRSSSFSLLDAIRRPVITPFNNLVYNTNTTNLATHGLHPHYQHFLVNLPQLLGPAFVVLILSLFIRPGIPARLNNKRAVSAISGTMILSLFPHQEPRFLIPCVPLLLTCIRPLKSRPFLATWIIFNAAMGFLMGVYHQGGVVPAQLEIPAIVSAWPAESALEGIATVFWWKTYSPPLWLLGDNSSFPVDIKTRDLMGIPGTEMIHELNAAVPECSGENSEVVTKHATTSDDSRARKSVFLVAPRSATFLDDYTRPSPSPSPSPLDPPLRLQELWIYRKHLNLDDLDFGDDGILPTLKRVIGRRGLAVWAVNRVGCE